MGKAEKMPHFMGKSRVACTAATNAQVDGTLTEGGGGFACSGKIGKAAKLQGR